VRTRLGSAVENRRKIIGTERNLEFFTVAYRYLVQILPVLVVSPLYFAGSIELGVITQSTGAFNNVLNDLSIVVNQFESLSSFSAGLTRLATFVDRMEGYSSGGERNATFRLSEAAIARAGATRPKRSIANLILYGQRGPPPAPATPSPAAATTGTTTTRANTAPPPPPPPQRSAWNLLLYGQKGPPSPPSPPSGDGAGASAHAASMHDRATSRVINDEVAALPGGHVLALRELSLLTPDGSRQLFANVSVDVAPGNHLLIMGNSGTGKSSMLRAIAGLWNRGAGRVTRPLVSQTMFLPQKPYCTLGSLRQQLVYPQVVEEWARSSTDETLLRALRAVRLRRLAERGAAGLDDVRDWGDELSLGEQQRLAFARVLINKPRLAILDEATSALDLSNEAVMYEAIGSLPNLTYVSVAHRTSLLRFHSSRLRLYGMEETPSFEVQPIDDVAIREALEASLATEADTAS